jgi:hypothetical protein
MLPSRMVAAQSCRIFLCAAGVGWADIRFFTNDWLNSGW